jgi:hypothetical protein
LRLDRSKWSKDYSSPDACPGRVEPGFEKEARGSDDSKDAENQVRGRGFGNVCNVAQVIRFLPEQCLTTTCLRLSKSVKGKSICLF